MLDKHNADAVERTTTGWKDSSSSRSQTVSKSTESADELTTPKRTSPALKTSTTPRPTTARPPFVYEESRKRERIDMRPLEEQRDHGPRPAARLPDKRPPPPSMHKGRHLVDETLDFRRDITLVEGDGPNEEKHVLVQVRNRTMTTNF